LQPARLRYTMPTTLNLVELRKRTHKNTKPALGEPYADIGKLFLGSQSFPDATGRVNRNCSIPATHLVCLQPGSKEPDE